MSDDMEFWRIEERFWLGGEEFFRERLDAECMMVFPQPVGILAGNGILKSLKGAPRWESVEMADRHTARTEGLATLAYLAEGRRQGRPAYRALCSSTYARCGGGDWRLVQHQQTPIGE
jgi:Domain of unknown function (DUF4440)